MLRVRQLERSSYTKHRQFPLLIQQLQGRIKLLNGESLSKIKKRSQESEFLSDISKLLGLIKNSQRATLAAKAANAADVNFDAWDDLDKILSYELTLINEHERLADFRHEAGHFEEKAWHLRRCVGIFLLDLLHCCIVSLKFVSHLNVFWL